jgi:hypothetical protein
MSLYPIFLAVLVGLAAAEESAPTGGLFGGRLAGIAEPRLASNAIRIVQLEKHIDKLRHRIKEAEHVDPQSFVHDLQARLDTLEGTHCDEHEFQCGSSGQECINDLLVCDGHDDCHNKHDEDEKVCSSTPVKAGHILRGLVHWDDCLVREDHLLTVNIISTKRLKFFQPRIIIHAVVTATYKDDEGHEVSREMAMKGGYNFANRRFKLIPEQFDHDSPHMILSCDFDHGDAERADCVIETEMTKASLRLRAPHSGGGRG